MADVNGIRAKSPFDHDADERAQGLFVEDRLSVFSDFAFPASELWRKVHSSPDGRFAYAFCFEPPGFVVVDLVLATQIVFTSQDFSNPLVLDFVVVSSVAVVVFATDGLWLFRLDAAEKTFERVALEPSGASALAYIFTEISGSGVDVQRAALAWNRPEQLRFVRLDVDRSRLEVDHVEWIEGTSRAYRSSEDGRSLYAINWDSPGTLHSFDLEEKTWTSEELTGSVDQLTPRHCFWTETGAYFCGYELVDNHTRYSVFRCDLEEREWRKLPLVARDIDRLAPIVNAETGQEDGLFVVCTDWCSGRSRTYRLLFRNPDPLVLLAAVALRRGRLHVDGEWGFHGCMQKMLYNRRLPPMYPNMTPIPRR
ncbi:hypothetical protein M3Y99_00138200 [Aphelenchoides fujianensis]|nr:hypothetical protein M3Y99_00138200 [Aphelenchoides fujianensis]